MSTIMAFVAGCVITWVVKEFRLYYYLSKVKYYSGGSDVYIKFDSNKRLFSTLIPLGTTQLSYWGANGPETDEAVPTFKTISLEDDGFINTLRSASRALYK